MQTPPLNSLFLLFVAWFQAYSLSAQSVPDLFVTSRNDNTVKRYNGETGDFIGNFATSDSSGLSRPQEVLFHSSGDLLVTGHDNINILRFDGETGVYKGPFTSGYSLDSPTKTMVGPDGYLYVSQWGILQNKVIRFDAETGGFIDAFTSQGVFQGCGQAWDSLGNLYVASWGNGNQGNVQKFDTAGQYLEIFIPTGIIQGPTNLWFADNGELHVADWSLGKVARFDGQTGDFLGNLITNITNPEGFVFDEEKRLYLCDWTGNIVLRYDSLGNFLGTFINSGGLTAPNSITFGPRKTTSLDRDIQDLQLTVQQPDSHRLLLSGVNPTIGPINLQLLSLKGEVLKYQDGSFPSGPFQWEVPTGELTSGMYILRLTANEKATQTIKVQVW